MAFYKLFTLFCFFSFTAVGQDKTESSISDKDVPDTVEVLPIILDRPFSPVNSWKEALKATVVLSKKDVHCSGFYIAPDYILTSYSAFEEDEDESSNERPRMLQDVSEVEDLLAIDANGRNLNLILERFDEELDVALYRTDSLSTYAFDLGRASMDTLVPGTEVLGIGTPIQKNLQNSISQGIISGVRSFDSVIVYQLDTRINYGDLGGPVVTKDGILIGMVTGKFIDFGVEGIGFSLMIGEAIEELKLEAK